MKIITILLLTLFLGKGCDKETQQDLKNTVIEYSARTRGFSQLVVIKNQEITIDTDRRGVKSKQSQKISDADWKILVSEFQKLELDKIKDLKAPTNKSSTDAAAMGQLLITHKEIKYTSQSFDNGNPPVAIAEFVNKAVEITKSIEKNNDDN